VLLRHLREAVFRKPFARARCHSGVA
jgi:hypothetical protein